MGSLTQAYPSAAPCHALQPKASFSNSKNAHKINVLIYGLGSSYQCRRLLMIDGAPYGRMIVLWKLTPIIG